MFLLRSERTTDALAIEKRHIYRSCALSGAGNRVTTALPRVTSRYLFFPMVTQYGNEVQQAAHVAGADGLECVGTGTHVLDLNNASALTPR